MEKVTSADGTAIAYDRVGHGDPVILVGGALCDRDSNRPLADALASRFDVITYDRRGRGDSGDTTPYAVEREVDDLNALLAVLGGTAALYGHSSGAGLAAIAASRGLPCTKIALHEPPYGPDDVDPSDDGEHVLELIGAGQGREAVELFLMMTGMPQAEALAIAATPGLAELAPTLAYDFAVMGYGLNGGGTPVELLRAVSRRRWYSQAPRPRRSWSTRRIGSCRSCHRPSTPNSLTSTTPYHRRCSLRYWRTSSGDDLERHDQVSCSMGALR